MEKMNEKEEELTQILRNSDNIVFFGVSRSKYCQWSS